MPRQRHDGTGRGAQGGGFTRRPTALRPLRTQAARKLQRHQGRYRPLSLRRHPERPRSGPLHLVGALRVDQAVGAEIVRLLQPLGVDAAVRAIMDCEHQAGEKQRQLELALEQARYEAARARRQYDAVDPDNRLVAGELERRWNAALAAVEVLEKERETLVRQ